MKPSHAMICFLALLAILLLPVPAKAASPSEGSGLSAGAADREYALTPEAEAALIETLAGACSDPGFPHAARVGIAAVLLRRSAGERDPRSGPITEAAVRKAVFALREEGAFGTAPDPSPVRSALLSAAESAAQFAQRLVGKSLSAALTGAADPDDPAGSRALSLARNAVRAAARGADPSGGAVNFRIFLLPGSGDLHFDDSREDGRKRELAEALADFPAAVPPVGFVLPPEREE